MVLFLFFLGGGEQSPALSDSRRRKTELEYTTNRATNEKTHAIQLDPGGENHQRRKNPSICMMNDKPGRCLRGARKA